MHAKDSTERMVISVDPEQTALFAQTYLSQNFGLLR